MMTRYYGIVTSTKTRVRCVFCSVYIPKAKKCIEEHINGTKHIDNTKLVNENGIRHVTNEGLFCKLCDMIIPEDQTLEMHVLKEKHVNWLAALDDLIEGENIRVVGFLASRTDKAYCETCRMKIPCTLQNLEQHVNKESHLKRISEGLKPRNGLFQVENRKEVWCKICDLTIEDTPLVVLEHIETNDRHVEWITEMEEYHRENGIYTGKYLVDCPETHVYCLRCKMQILCHTEDIDLHNMTDSHISAPTPTLAQTKVILFQLAADTLPPNVTLPVV